MMTVLVALPGRSDSRKQPVQTLVWMSVVRTGTIQRRCVSRTELLLFWFLSARWPQDRSTPTLQRRRDRIFCKASRRGAAFATETETSVQAIKPCWAHRMARAHCFRRDQRLGVCSVNVGFPDSILRVLLATLPVSSYKAWLSSADWHVDLWSATSLR
jgi:hypothetical protein